MYISAQNLEQAENLLFLQIKSGRILNIVGVFNITPLALVGYDMIIANSANLDHWIDGILLASSK